MSETRNRPWQSVFRVLWGTYIRNALIPILFIELALVGAYLATNYLIRDENVATLQRQAQESLLETAKIEASVISSQLSGVAEMADLFAQLTRHAYQTPYQASPEELSRYITSPEGVWYSRDVDAHRASMFYSSITPIGERERTLASQLVQLDPLMQQLVESSALVAQAYVNTDDSMNRIYPGFEVLEQYPSDLNVTHYNFYYEADAEHNPERGVVFTDVYIDPAGQGWMASAIAPVYSAQNDRLEAVVGLDIRVSEIIQQVLGLSLPWNSYALLIDSQGTILALPEAGERDWQLNELTDHQYANAIEQDTFKPEEFNVLRRADSRPLAEGLTQQAMGTVPLALNGAAQLAAWAKIPAADWHLVIVTDQAQLYADAEALKARVDQIGIGMIVGLLAFYLLFILFLYRKSVRVSLRLSQPMEGLERMIDSLGEGDFHPLAVATDVIELDSVSRGLTTLGHTLESNRQQLAQAHQSLEQLNQALEQRVIERTQELELANQALVHEREELQATQAQLVQSEKMASIGVLSTGVAHEINNPLAFVSANMHILNDQVPALLDLYQQCAARLPDEQRRMQQPLEQQAGLALMIEEMPELLEDALEGVRRIRHITESLLEFSHSGNTSRQSCQLNHCVESTLVICQHELKYRAQVQLALEDSLPAIEAVPAQINQVIMVLVMNALQAIGEEGSIRIVTQCRDDGVLLAVEDNGCGILPEHIDRIFEPFFTTKDVGQGTGLGLAMAYGIVKTHQGTIAVSSRIGEGSRFEVWLPLHQHKPLASDPLQDASLPG